MKIANYELSSPLVAAPMAGFSGRAYREIVRDHGAGTAVTEMVSAQAICYGNQRTRELLDLEGEAGPRIVQLFASKPDFLREAAAVVKEIGADVIDLNMGCPVPKVVKNGEGSALLREPKLAAELVQAAASCGLPVSVKMRLGFAASDNIHVDFAKAMEAAGAAFITVHGRYREQFYAGQADWDKIAEVKQAVSIPVIGNGDIDSPATALKRLAGSGVDALMIGRATLGDPWLFGRIRAALGGEPEPELPSWDEVCATALRLLRRQRERFIYWRLLAGFEPARAEVEGEYMAVCSLRAQLGHFFRGWNGAAALRNQLNTLGSVAEIEALLASVGQPTRGR
ncbi:MAG: tRNA dihydrouridine synthase DusB [Firmicutes bacterium]|nr:tRNA dihydrouridine synthase DusB [Bacillota bacterium]